MPVTLDIVALRSLVAIVDCGGFHRAAQTLHLSQSAVSQHVRRLEKAIGQPLVVRSGRATRLTPAGEVLVAEARTILGAHDEALQLLGVDEPVAEHTITVGATEHAAHYLLPEITRALVARFPAAEVRFRLDRGMQLSDALQHGRLDVAVFLGEVGAEGGMDAGSLPLSWFAAPGWAAPPADQPLPLVAIDDPCTIRRQALRTLAARRRKVVIMGEAGHLAGVMNAARAGLGVALLADVGPTAEGLERRTDLPPVKPERMHVRVRGNEVRDLLEVTSNAVRTALSAASYA